MYRKEAAWKDLLDEITNEVLAKPQMAKLTDTMRQSYRDVDADIVAVATEILRRPPVYSDFDEDVVELVMKRFIKRGDITQTIRVRLKRLQALDALVSKRFARDHVNFDKMPTCRRMTFNDLPENPNQLPDFKAMSAEDPTRLEMPLTLVMEHYRRDRLTGKSPNSSRLMDYTIRVYSKWLGRHAVLGDLTKDRVIDFTNWMIESTPMTRASIRTMQERLLATWRYAAYQRWLPSFPDFQLVKAPARTPDAWTTEDMLKLLETAKAMPGTMGREPMKDVPWALFWETIILFTYDTAERIGAVREVKHDDLRGEWVTVRAECRKGKSRDKTFKLRPLTLENIAKIRKLAPSAKRIFEFPWCYTYLYNLTGKLLESAGLPSNRRTKFHKLRRTSASDFEAAGGSATKLLDHKNAATTEKYLDPRVVKEVQHCDIVPAIGAEKVDSKQPDDAAELLEKLRNMLGTR